jgi:hypothetical protein
MIRNTILIAVLLLACRALMSCGTTCVAGVINNGTTTVLVRTSTPPPACPFSMGMGTMNVAVAKSKICETCTASGQAQHIFVTLKSIQLHSVFPESPNNPEWLELAPELLGEPRQIDLLDDAVPEILVQSASVPAGTYGGLRVQFLPDADTLAGPDTLPGKNSCGQTRRNCMLMADGRAEQLDFAGTGDSPELLLPFEYNGGSAVVVLPGATVHLRLTLQPQQVSAVTPSDGWQIHYVLMGSATASR